MSFLETFNHFNFESYQARLNSEDDGQILRILDGRYPPQGLETFALLLSPAANRHLEFLAQKAQQLTAERHGKVIRLYAPAYMSNECTNTCTYCGFTMENKINRKTLNAKEMEGEAKYLHARGFRQ